MYELRAAVSGCQQAHARRRSWLSMAVIIITITTIIASINKGRLDGTSAGRLLAR